MPEYVDAEVSHLSDWRMVNKYRWLSNTPFTPKYARMKHYDEVF